MTNEETRRPNWGGKRAGAGRPKGTLKTNNRQHITASVAPATWEKLHRQAERLGLSRGKIIDRWSREKSKSRHSPPTS